MTAEQKLAELRMIAAQKPRTGLRTALREVSAKAERFARYEELRACVAANPDTSGDLMSKVIRRWYNMDFANISKEAKAAADSIHGSVKALMRDDVSIESAIDFYSEMLGCTPDELGG